MAGVKGRSGRRPLPISHHLLRGTFRPDRHGPRPVQTTEGATALQQSPVSIPDVPADVVADLGERGRQFVQQCWREYDRWTPATLVLLRQAGLLVDELEGYRVSIVAHGYVIKGPNGATVPHPLLRAERQGRATLLTLIAALQLKDE